MDLTFGARLRQQREQQHVTLTAIAAATKIKLSLLQELESDNMSHWPSGLYRRAYLRDYARAIGLDPETVVKEFLELHPDPSMTPEPGPDGDANGDGAAPPRPETGFRRLFAAVLGSPWPDRDPVAERLAATRALIARDAMIGHEAVEPPPGFDDLAEVDDRPSPMPQSELDILEAGQPAEPATCEVSVGTIADLCTRLAQARHSSDVEPVLADAAQLLDAVGIIVWAWDARGCVLAPVLAHGYDASLLARLRGVRREAPNAIAAAFRAAEPCIVAGAGDATGALVVPMLAPAGCAGVVAFELQYGAEQQESVVSAARILAAQLATLISVEAMAEAVNG